MIRVISNEDVITELIIRLSYDDEFAKMFQEWIESKVENAVESDRTIEWHWPKWEHSDIECWFNGNFNSEKDHR